jgi:hypothetical protein
MRVRKAGLTRERKKKERIKSAKEGKKRGKENRKTDVNQQRRKIEQN